MKRFLPLACLLAMPFTLTSCEAIADSMFNRLLGGAGDDDDYHESREKRERRAQYRSDGKPSLSID